MWISRRKYRALSQQLVRVEAKLDALSKTKNLDNASYELKEFLADVMEHGCGIVKIAPDSIFIRGLRK